MDLTPLRQDPPRVLSRRAFRGSRFLRVEQVDLKFSNGVEATYERIMGGRGAVMLVPFDGERFHLVSEYAVGVEGYALGLAKGKIDAGETPAQAAARELAEELGLGARRLVPLKSRMSVAPGMMTLTMYPFLCTDLYPHRRPGDEPEPIRDIAVTAEELRDLIFTPDSPLEESRAIAALTLAMGSLGLL
ncbi:MAG: ADP compounds hydrolase NudE [Succinivibrionaceae bacterium]|nr:ADP compounds hydrolase NudE [Succinivibrionaceae bacterium]